MRSWRSSTPLRLRFQKPRLARWWQNKRQKTPDAPALADARYLFSYREMREQVVALANLLRERGVKPGGTAWRWHYRARSF